MRSQLTIFCNLARLPVLGLGHQFSHKTFCLLHALFENCGVVKVVQNLWEWPNNEWSNLRLITWEGSHAWHCLGDERNQRLDSPETSTHVPEKDLFSPSLSQTKSTSNSTPPSTSCTSLYILLTSSYSLWFYPVHFLSNDCLLYLLTYGWLYLTLLTIANQKALGLKGCCSYLLHFAL